MKIKKSSFRGFWGLGVVVLLASLAFPQTGQCTPRETLLALVPDDISFCIVVNNLREHIANLKKSKTTQQLRQLTPIKIVTSAPETKQLWSNIDDLKKHLQVSLEQFVNEVVGDCVVVAFHHDPTNTGKERGLVLVWARKSAVLTRVVHGLDNVLTNAGDIIKLDDGNYRGITYQHRREGQRKHHYFFQRDKLLVWSNNELLIKRAIDQHLRDTTVSQTRTVRDSIARLPHKNAVVTFWGNPHAFHEDLRKKIAQGNVEEKQALGTFARCWKALDAWALSISVQPNLELACSLQGRVEALPAPMRKLVTGFDTPSDLVGRFPKTSVLTVMDRVDSESLLATIQEFMTPAARQQFRTTLQKNVGALMGLDFAKEVLPNLGPDYGLFVAAAPDTKHFPHALFALRIQPGNKAVRVDQAIYNNLNSWVFLAVLGHNNQNQHPITIKTLRKGKVTIKYLYHEKFPIGLQPAYALKDGYLVLATAPAAIDRFQKSNGKVAPLPPLRLSFQELAKLLDQHQDHVVQLMTQNGQLTPQTARQAVREIHAALQIFDRLEWSRSASRGQMTWRLRVVAK